MARLSLNTSLDPSSKNPWDALFASTTRPRIRPTSNIPSINDIRTHPSVENCNDASSSPSEMAGGYTILIQHSITSQSQRDYAFSSAVNEGSVPHSVTRAMGSLSVSRPSQSSSRASDAAPSARGEWFGITGSFLVRKTFEELCCRCDGSVVLVTLLGKAGVVDLESLNGFNNHVYNDRGEDYDGHGHEHDVRKRGQKEINRRKQATQLFRQYGAVVDLASNPFGWAEEPMDAVSDGFITESKMNNLQSIANVIRAAAVRVENHRKIPQNAPSQKQYGQQPIPIIFDSLTPLLSLHGVHNVVLLLQSFKQAALASQPSILSPVVAPILYESMRPSDHRSLEDIADALLSLQLMQIERQNSEIASGVLDVVRRGGSGNGLGGKLMQDCIPVHIMAAIEYSSINGRNFDARDKFYWILDCHNNSSQKKQSPNEHGDAPRRNSESEAKQSAENAQPTPRPRIYLEDDDPEFDDLDEEDPDDDLDL
ncbi:hypothetical protein ACHAW6_006242 [Cyclotella cf. meneghiniana]